MKTLILLAILILAGSFTLKLKILQRWNYLADTRTPGQGQTGSLLLSWEMSMTGSVSEPRSAVNTRG